MPLYGLIPTCLALYQGRNGSGSLVVKHELLWGKSMVLRAHTLLCFSLLTKAFSPGLSQTPVASIVSPGFARRIPGKPDPQHMRSSSPVARYRQHVQKAQPFHRVHGAGTCSSELKASSEELRHEHHLALTQDQMTGVLLDGESASSTGNFLKVERVSTPMGSSLP